MDCPTQKWLSLKERLGPSSWVVTGHEALLKGEEQKRNMPIPLNVLRFDEPNWENWRHKDL